MKYSTASRIDKSAALAFLVALAAERQNFPSADAWAWTDQKAGWPVLALIAGAGIFSLAPFSGYAERGLVQRRNHVQRLVLSSFGKLLSEAQRVNPAMNLGDMGLHAWRVRRGFFKFWQVKLERVATFRIGSTVMTRPFRPARGIGTVGQCWKHNREVDFDVEKISEQAVNETLFDRYRSQNGEDAVMGMTWSEFSNVSHRGSVFAVPLRKKAERFRGCVSLDFSGGHMPIKESTVPDLLKDLASSLDAHAFEEI